MRVYPFQDLVSNWEKIQKYRPILEQIDEEGSKFYAIGSPKNPRSDETVGEYFDRLPDEIRELEKEGLVSKHLDNGDMGQGVRCEVTSIGEELLEKDSFEEANKWRLEFLEKIEKTYSSTYSAPNS